MVERDLAKVEVASSTLVSRSNLQEVGSSQNAVGGEFDRPADRLQPTAYFHFRRRSQVVRQRSAKPLFIGSIPIAASNRINNLERPSSVAFSICPRNVHEFLRGD